LGYLGELASEPVARHAIPAIAIVEPGMRSQ
jgi:hypothetical protein